MRMVILAAGLGSRLAAESEGRPKQLLDVGGRTLLERQLEIAALAGCRPWWSAGRSSRRSSGGPAWRCWWRRRRQGSSARSIMPARRSRGRSAGSPGTCCSPIPRRSPSMVAKHLAEGGGLLLLLPAPAVSRPSSGRGTAGRVRHPRGGAPPQHPEFLAPLAAGFLLPGARAGDALYMLRVIAAGEPIRSTSIRPRSSRSTRPRTWRRPGGFSGISVAG